MELKDSWLYIILIEFKDWVMIMMMLLIIGILVFKDYKFIIFDC